MPDGHLSDSQIARYLAQTLPPDQILALHGHLDGCADCGRMLRAAAGERYAGAVVTAAEAHLGEDELAEFLAGHLAEERRERAARHLAECGECAADAEAMRGADPAVRRRPRGLPYWAIAAGVAVLAAGAWLLRQPAGPVLVASLRDAGGTVGLDAGGALRGLAGVSGAESGWVAEALRSGRLPAAPPLGPAEGALRSGEAPPPEFHVLAPAGTRVLSDRPAFSWSPVAGAEYEVLVTDQALAPLARSGRLQAPAWTPRDPLPRGRRLLWQVNARRGGRQFTAPAPPDPPAVFQIVAAETALEIERARRAPHPSHLLLAVLYGRAGMPAEQAAELQALAAANAGSAVVESLRRSAQ